jgi:hypothetical protein
MGKYIRLLLPALAILLVSCPADTAGAAKGRIPADAVLPADLMGLVHAGTDSVDQNKIADEYNWLDTLHVTWTLKDFSWGSIQSADKKDEPPENWNWSGFDALVHNGNEHNKKILALLDYDVAWLHGAKTGEETVKDNTPLGAGVKVDKYSDGHLEGIVAGEDEIARFCAYVTATVSRYKDKVGAWCIWNEPNLYPRFWTGTPEQFYTLTKAAANAIRQADPGALIVGGALNSTATDEWVRGFFTSDAMKNVDVIAYHPYAPNANGSAALYRHFRDITADYGFDNKIWVTEVGYPTEGTAYATKVDEARMPQMVTKTIVQLAAEGAQKIFWYHIADPETAKLDKTDPEDWFGLLKTDDNGVHAKKGGADAYALCAQYLSGKTWRYQGLPGLSLSEDVYAYYFEGTGTDKGRCLVVWNDKTYKSAEITLPLPDNSKIHDLANGGAQSITTNSYTLEPSTTGSTKDVLFFTWDAP